ncbi:hypothetical protein [Paenibacillus amylolyticus]|uniref:hypothetical protein n=1 Tax=Paenibacillus amylolyticus TaxID=1451 RepID=UPI003D963DA1
MNRGTILDRCTTDSSRTYLKEKSHYARDSNGLGGSVKKMHHSIESYFMALQRIPLFLFLGARK